MNYLKLIILSLMLFHVVACDEKAEPESPSTYNIYFNITAEEKNIFEYDHYSVENAGLIYLTEENDTIHYSFNESHYVDKLNYFVLSEPSNENLFLDFGNGDIDTIQIEGRSIERAYFIDYMEVYYNNELVETYDFKNISKDSMSDFINRNEGAYSDTNIRYNPVVIEVEKQLEVGE